MPELKLQSIGNGPDLIMLHGWAMHSGIWRHAAEQLAQHHRVHMLDLPGHGINHDSALPLDPSAIADELAGQLPPAHWLGWSLGGLIALQTALDRPEQVTSLTMVASSPCFVHRDHWPHGMDGTVFDRFAEELDSDFQGTLNRFLALEVHGSEDARRTLKQLRENAFSGNRPTLAALQQGLELLHNIDLSQRLNELQCPSLWLSGRRDRLVSWRAMQTAADSAANAQHQVQPGAGHAPFIGHRDDFAALVNGFLASRQPEQRQAAG